MSLKLQISISLAILMAIARNSRCGLVPLENTDHNSEHHHVSLASSFMHFHGPVEGPEFEVKVPYVAPHHQYGDEHNHISQDHQAEHGYTIDYVAHPKYEFSYGVEDHHTGDFHGQKETRDGSSVSGEYSIKEPGGTIRVVTYRADKDGFHAVVHTTGKNDHSSAYGAHSHAHHIQSHDSQEVVTHHETHHGTQHDEALENYAAFTAQDAYQ